MVSATARIAGIKKVAFRDLASQASTHSAQTNIPMFMVALLITLAVAAMSTILLVVVSTLAANRAAAEERYAVERVGQLVDAVEKPDSAGSIVTPANEAGNPDKKDSFAAR